MLETPDEQGKLCVGADKKLTWQKSFHYFVCFHPVENPLG